MLLSHVPAGRLSAAVDVQRLIGDGIAGKGCFYGMSSVSPRPAGPFKVCTQRSRAPGNGVGGGEDFQAGHFVPDEFAWPSVLGGDHRLAGN
jgi:hypothetical protein